MKTMISSMVTDKLNKNSIKYTITNISLLIIFLYFFLFLQKASAQNLQNWNIISLENGQFVKVQVCSKKIIRIQVSKSRDVKESLLEKYEIVNKNWVQEEVTKQEDKNNWKVKTESLQLSINRASGEFSFNDNVGNLVCKGSFVLNTNDALIKKLESSFKDYFSAIKPVYAILGEGDAEKKIVDSTRVEPSIVQSVVSFDISDDERFYGGGTTSRKNIQHRGEALRMWATYKKTELPMPFIMSSRGWGVFDNTTELNYFDIGRFTNDKMYISNTETTIDFYLMAGESMSETINLFTSITGKPYLLPKWAYGLAFGPNEKEEQFHILNDALRFRQEKIPCDIIWLEPQWMEKFHDFSANKKWNFSKFEPEFFANQSKLPKKEEKGYFISNLHNLNFKTALWICHNHDLTIEEDDFLSYKTGLPQSGKEHWFAHLNNFIDQGIDGFKLDPGRTLMEHPSRLYHNGLKDREMHNLNQVLLPKQMYRTFRERKGIRSFHHYCGGYAGTQHWTAMTCGDNGGGKASLFDQLNVGMSGYVNTSIDLETSLNGLHYGFFSPWVQLNSWASLRHPWFFNELEKEAFKFYSEFRYALIPYIYSAAIHGSQTGMPILRGMPLVYPNDTKVANMTSQYMFGENLLVGVFSDSIYLPKGNWINWWTGEKVSGGKTVHPKIPANRGGALFVKNGSIIPLQKSKQFVSKQSVDTLIVKVFPQETCSFDLLEDDGETFLFEKGEFATTTITCVEKQNQLELMIAPIKGSYKNMPSIRTYQLEINSKVKPKQIIINGTSINKWHWGANQILEFMVSTKVTEPLKIIIK
jgi:alpha-glucosidase